MPRHDGTPRLALMLLLWASAMLALASAGCQEEAGKPGPNEAGPYGLTTLSHTLTRGDRETPVVAHLPEGAPPSPLVVFTPGLALESLRYIALAEHIASHGFVVIRADPPAPLSNVDHPAMAADVLAVLDWALAPGSPLEGRVDGTRVATMGHSLGGKVAAMVAYRDPRVGALFTLDPVATCGGPTGGCSEKNPDILSEEVPSLTIPLAFAGETTDATGGMGGQSCAPEDGNFERFYEAAAGTSGRSPWVASFDFIGANHIDFVFDQEDCIPCLFCQTSTADPEVVRAGLTTLATAFLRLHLGGDLAMEPWLLGERLPPGIARQHLLRP